jgi:hypothetical protein
MEHNMGEIRKVANAAPTQIRIHMRQHANDVLARTSRVPVRSQPIVKLIGNVPQ